MTPNNKRKKEETVAAVIASVNGTGSDGKRQCTAQSTTTGDTSGIVSVEQEPPGEATQQQPPEIFLFIRWCYQGTGFSHGNNE